MTADPNGWPDPSRPGVPLNPELPGAHALKDTGGTVAVMLWRDPWWHPSTGWAIKPAEMVAARWRYLGPCLPPAEVAARVAEARAKALEEARLDAFNNGMDEGATRAIKSLARWLDVKEWEGGDGTETWDGDVSVEIGNVLAEADIYDNETGNAATHTLLRASKNAALREAAKIARDVRQQANECAREPNLIPSIRREFLAQGRGAEDVEQAILARIKETPHG